MKTNDVKTAILELVDSDPDGFGRLPSLLSKRDWKSCLSHAAGFLGAKLSEASVPFGKVLLDKGDYEELVDIAMRYRAAVNFAPSTRMAACGHYVCDGYICTVCGKDPSHD